MMVPEYTIRECTSIEEFEACLNLQRAVWQYDSLDLTPLRAYVANQRVGGFTLGAYEADQPGAEPGRLIGFAHALPALDARRTPYYYSQMLAIEPNRQNGGIGARLKLAQREYALRHGIGLIDWTFDPMQSRNARLNLAKLGGVVRRYLVNHYGTSSTSVLHQGLDTDRLVLEWWVKSKHVAETLAGRRRTDRPEAIVEIPREIGAQKRTDPETARAWQSKVRQEFQRHLEQGLYCAGFEVDPDGGPSRYLFFKDDRVEERSEPGDED
ncbi:MAG TPA: GNAT family N-acetyltransferase [Blastocatellia bacterium]|nr:GNAT family N-acetyltransferase [Blastocatellia bacterium]